MNTAPYIIVNMLINFALLLLFFRFIIQLAGIDHHDPYAKTAYKLTGVVDVFERIFPSVGDRRISTAAVMLMILLFLINLAANAAILGKDINAVQLFFVGTLSAIVKFIAMLRYTLIASAVASLLMVLLNVNHSVIGLLMQLSEPIVAPFRRFVPNLGMLDLSFIVALFSLMLLERFIQIIGANILTAM